MKPVSIIALAAVFIVSVSWSKPYKQRHVQYRGIDVSLQLNDDYSDTPHQHKLSVGASRHTIFTYAHRYDTAKHVAIDFADNSLWKFATNNAPYPTLETLEHILTISNMDNPKANVEEKREYLWIDSVRYLFHRSSTAGIPGRRTNTITTIPDSTCLINITHEDGNYNAATDSAAANQMIDSLVQSVRIIRK
ncbi:MAG: hypothetical protein EOP51_01240 [Sphingobacteriales bacterium]|nr:MAG: hypothetical protein EOP51_01240 [Sphingobacteriales bacterium]